MFSQAFDKESNKNISPGFKKNNKIKHFLVHWLFIYFWIQTTDIPRWPDAFENSEEKQKKIFPCDFSSCGRGKETFIIAVREFRVVW